jgi:hypothetical protein
MFRAFNIALADTNWHNLFSLIVGTAVYGAAQGGSNETEITGAVPSAGILPDKGNFLRIDVSSAGTVTIADNNYANAQGPALGTSLNLIIQSSKNTICFKDYWVKASASTQDFTVCLEVQ